MFLLLNVRIGVSYVQTPLDVRLDLCKYFNKCKSFVGT